MCHLCDAEAVLEAITAFRIAANGDSGDDEHDAGVELAYAVEAYLRNEAEKSPTLKGGLREVIETFDQQKQSD